MLFHLRPTTVPGAERCRVSFGTRDGWRAVGIVIAPTGEYELRASMAWAAYQIADAFQDEVTELSGIAHHRDRGGPVSRPRRPAEQPAGRGRKTGRRQQVMASKLPDWNLQQASKPG